MADGEGEGRRNGNALRSYQLLLVLGVGWLAGRLPDMMDGARAEQATLMTAMAGAQQQPLPAQMGVEESRFLAAQIAADVASRVSRETVAGLIAAGWGPRDQAPYQIIVQQPAPVRAVEVARETQPAAPIAPLDWRLEPGTAIAEAPVAAPRTAPAGSPGHALASSGYAALAEGDKRRAARQFSAALAAEPNAPQAEQWQADLRQLKRRWQVSAYTVAREGGVGDPLAASPVLGAGQSGAAVAYKIDPLSSRPISIVGRVTAAAGTSGAIDRETVEAALGVRVEPLRGVPLAVDVERRFALGIMSRNAWAARISGGGAVRTQAVGLPVTVEGWGEAGIVGFHARPDLYAGAQLRGGTPLFSLGRTDVDAGVGTWAAIQRGWGQTASRVDVGPSARVRIKPWPFYAQVDYRLRTLGNALPQSGPVVTIAGDF